MMSYVIGTAVFIVGSTVLVQFVIEPPGNPGQSLEQQELRSRAQTALDVLMGTPGYPADWDATTPDKPPRLGLLEEGTNVRLAPTKFETLARGRFHHPSDGNGLVDYAEAKAALGLQGYDFHLRGAPAIPLDAEGFYGTKGMGDYRVAYIRDKDISRPGGETQAAELERAALHALDVGFNNNTRLNLAGIGDAYDDDAQILKTALVPQLGTSVTQVAISEGTGPAHDFHRVNSTQFKGLVASPGSAHALALSKMVKGVPEPGYTKGREIRAIVATANLSGQASATITWNEHVNTNGTTAVRDGGDYGFLEVSPDGGATWIALTNTESDRSQDSPARPQVPGVWKSRSVTLTTFNCGACLGSEEVRIAFHWVADKDNDVGHGWIVDDVTVKAGVVTLLSENLEEPYYDLLVIGTGVDQKALTAAEIKNAVRDFVVAYGGRLVVLGGDRDVQWLQPLFHVAMKDASDGVANPDPTHPLLTTPNELDWRRYDDGGKAWDFAGTADGDLFDMVVGTGDDQHTLGASSPGAFGTAEGGIILTTFRTEVMPETQRLSFLANAITYGLYNHLFMEVGPEVPTDVPVAAVARTAVMEKSRDGSGEYGEMTFIMYLWRGDAAGASATSPVPSEPRSFSATAGDDKVTLAWQPPSNKGASGALTAYEVYRGTAPGYLAKVKSLGPNDLTWVDNQVDNGITYYYKVLANSTLGAGAPSSEKHATPAGLPGAPGFLSAVGGAGQILLSWNDPASNGGAAITGFKIYRSTSSSFDATESTYYTTVGATNSFTDVNVGSDDPRHYRVVAVNSVGDGPATGVAGGRTLAVPTAPPKPALTPGLHQITVTWSPPLSATPIAAYHVYAGNTAESTSKIGETGNATFTYVESGLGSGVTRHYRVLAVNSAGQGALSEAASVSTLKVSSAPTNLQAVGGPDRITLTWQLPTDPGSHPGMPLKWRIHRGETSTTVAYLTDANGNWTNWTDPNLPDATTRFYRVSAVTGAGEGDLSDVASATTHDVATAPVLAGTPDYKTSILTWTAPTSLGHPDADLSHYSIFRTTVQGVYDYAAPIANVTADTTTHGDTQLDPALTYWYVVRAVTQAGVGTPSNEIAIKPLGDISLDDPLGI